LPLGASLVHAGPARGPAADYRATIPDCALATVRSCRSLCREPLVSIEHAIAGRAPSRATGRSSSIEEDGGGPWFTGGDSTVFGPKQNRTGDGGGAGGTPGCRLRAVDFRGHAGTRIAGRLCRRPACPAPGLRRTRSTCLDSGGDDHTQPLHGSSPGSGRESRYRPVRSPRRRAGLLCISFAADRPTPRLRGRPTRDPGMEARATGGRPDPGPGSGSLEDRLVGSGFDPFRPAFLSWLGVTQYLTTDAIRATLDVIAAPRQARSWSWSTWLGMKAAGREARRHTTAFP